MLSKDITAQLLTIGPHFTPPKGGIAQVIDNYRRFILGDDTFYICNSDTRGKFINTWLFFKGLHQLSTTLKKHHSIKIVHIHTASFISFRRAVFFAKAAKRLGKKVVMHIHGGAFKDFYASNSDYIKKSLSICDAVIVLSPTWKEFFEQNNIHHNIHVVNNVIEPPTLHPVPSDGRIHALFLGLLTKSKGIYDLLNAINSIKEQLRGRFLLHIGGNGETQKVETFIRENQLEDIAVFEGWVGGDKKIELLNKSALNILPSYNEGMPLSLLEALGYGHVIIATAVGAIPEIVDDTNGFLLQPGKVNDLANAILNAVNNAQLLKTLAHSARQRAAAFAPICVETNLLGVYNSLLDS